MSTEVSAEDVKALRERTGAGIMDSKAALKEAEGDVNRAIEILRVKGQAAAAKRSGRGTGEGVIGSYVHTDRRIGVLVEVQCETDFVARTEEFQDFAYEVALHVAASDARYVSADEIPDEAREAERKVLEDRAREDGKPDDVIGKIVDGQLAKWTRDVTLLEQEHVNVDKHESKTIEELRTEISAKTGENVRIARFVKYRVGEE
jgi:elongation factor Ts